MIFCDSCSFPYIKTLLKVSDLVFKQNLEPVNTLSELMLRTLNLNFLECEDTLKRLSATFLRLLTSVGYFSKTKSDTFRSVSVYGKEQEPRKNSKQ